VTAEALLDNWTAHAWDQGVRVDRLSPFDRLTVITRHSTYEIVVLTPATADVVIRGGAFFPDFTRGRILGSSLGGSFLKLHTVHLGFCLELADGARSILTSPVQDVSLAPWRSARH
jgi:hypothetical protein